MSVELDENRLVEQVEEVHRDLFENAMRRWFASSQRWLEEATEQRAGGRGADDSGGRKSRADTGLFSILQSGQLTGWRGDTLEFVYTHPASEYHEFGTRPHEIRAKDAETLAFEWPDAPQEVREMFEDTFPLVFFKEVLHPGTPAISFVRRGREAAVEYLEGRGVSTVDVEDPTAGLNPGAKRWIEERGLA